MSSSNDSIIIKYGADVSALEHGATAIEKDLRDIESASKKSLGTVAAESKKAGIAMQGTTKSVDTLKTSLSSLADNLPFAGQIKQATELGSAITGLGGSAQKSSAGFQILKLAIAGTGIGLLVIAIVSLISYFKRTDEGAAKLTGVLSAFGAAADLVTGFVIGFGEGVFKAFTSIDNFKQGLSDLGDFILNNTINRFKAFGVYLDAISLALSGEYKLAAKKAADASIQLTTGIVDATSKIQAFAEKAAVAAAAAYEWELRMDALDDKIREDSKTIASNDAAITKLIIASKNKNIEDEKSLGFLDQATKLEKQNLAITLQNETAKLRLIQERNQRESDSINQDIKNGNTRRSINDQQVQEEVDQINKITGIRQASDNLLEKVNNRRDAKLEEIFQNQVKRITEEEILQENLAKQSYIDGTTSAQQLEDRLYQIKLQGLNNQKELLVTNSRDIVDIDKAILDLELQNKAKSEKEKADLQKKADDAAAKEQKDRLAVEAKYKADADKAKADKQKEHEAKIKAIVSASADVLGGLATGLYNDLNQKRQNDLAQELNKAQKTNDAAQKALQDRLDKGIISQEEFNSKKATLDNKQAKKEADIKLKQFQQNKKAQLVDIAINTAVAIVKTIANLGYPAGVVAAAIAAAAGLAQAAVIAAQPTPKFYAKGKVQIDGPGTGTSDSIPAMISRGESVITAAQTSKHLSALNAIHNDSFEDYLISAVPTIRGLQRDSYSRREAEKIRSEQLLKSFGGSDFDTSKMEYYLNRNKNVGIKNVDEIGKSIAKELSKNNSWFR